MWTLHDSPFLESLSVGFFGALRGAMVELRLVSMRIESSMGKYKYYVENEVEGDSDSVWSMHREQSLGVGF